MGLFGGKWLVKISTRRLLSYGEIGTFVNEIGASENVCAEWRWRLIDILEGTVWRRPIGRHKLLVIFRKRAANYRALLRKMTDENDRLRLIDILEGTEWRRCIRCLELQVMFRKRATHYRALLRKMTYKDKASYGSWPPCTYLYLW